MLQFNPLSFRLLPLTRAWAERVFGKAPETVMLMGYLNPGTVMDGMPMAPHGFLLYPPHHLVEGLGPLHLSGFTHPAIEAFFGTRRGEDHAFTFSLEDGEIVVRPGAGSTWPPALGSEQRFSPLADDAMGRDFAQPFHDREFVEWVAKQGILPDHSVRQTDRRVARSAYRFGAVAELAPGVVLVTSLPRSEIDRDGKFLIYLTHALAEKYGVESVLSHVPIISLGIPMDTQVSCSMLRLDAPDLDHFYQRSQGSPLERLPPFREEDLRIYVWQREPHLWRHRAAAAI